MRKITFYALDDEADVLDEIEALIMQIPGADLIGRSTRVETALAEIEELDPDVLITDIQMPQIMGLEIVKRVAAISSALIIVISGYSHYAVEAFELNVADYLVKPIVPDRFLLAVQRVRTHLEKLQAAGSRITPSFFVKNSQRHLWDQVAVNSIDMVKAQDYMVTIHKGADKLWENCLLKDIEDRLPSELFIRVHKSYLVAIAAINTVDTSRLRIILRTGQEIPIGRYYRENLLLRLGIPE